MTKILNMQERLESKKQKEQLRRYRGSLETIRKIVQCSSCRLRCAMCGMQIENPEAPDDACLRSSGLTFCSTCRAEYEEFLSISENEKQPTVFWHNKEWRTLWSAWLNYRKAISDFTASPEFKRLIEVLHNDD